MELFILCVKIFFARILDVSLGTVRTIISVKGRSFLAACIGFCEVFVWFLVAREALNTNETSAFIAISYSLGYATGTYIGTILSKVIIKGNLSLQIITNKKNEMADKIREEGFAVSTIEVSGKENDEEKHMLFIEIDKKKLDKLKKIIKSVDEKAFVVVNETKYVQNGYIK